MREGGWEGLPPPPSLTTGKPDPNRTGREDLGATPVAISLGLPNTDVNPQVSQSPPPKLTDLPETEVVAASPVTQPPSVSIATLSDFTIADPFDDESPIDPTVITPHETFNFEDGNVEVLCRKPHPLSCPRQPSFSPFPCPPSDVYPGQSYRGGIPQRMPSHCVL